MVDAAFPHCKPSLVHLDESRDGRLAQCEKVMFMRRRNPAAEFEAITEMNDVEAEAVNAWANAMAFRDWGSRPDVF
jgi:hypothetical protein